MRGPLLLALAVLALTTAGSAMVSVTTSPGDALRRAQAESDAANRRVEALERAIATADSDAAELRARQLAAAAEIEAAEAKIALSSAALRDARAALALRESELAHKRAPTAALLAGLASMSRQPPLLALADGTSVDELVRVRALLDTTMPVIKRRSAALAAEVRRDEALAQKAAAARNELVAGRKALQERQTRFAALEREAAARSAGLAGAAFGEQDRVLASGEAVADLRGEASAAAAARANARRLAALGLSPPSPFAGEAGDAPPAIAYSLPAAFPVIEGLGSVSTFGVESRGLTLATPRGAQLIAPADGTLLFAGPFRDHDGVVIIDHGGGWTSLLLNVSTRLPKGGKVRRGEPLGSALGSVGVELRHRGRPVSAALIAGSSVPLSNTAENR
jgi:septal ring factor EnvC (AmiA/AmiB activator)